MHSAQSAAWEKILRQNDHRPKNSTYGRYYYAVKIPIILCGAVFVDDFEEHLGMQNVCVCVEHLGTNGILYIWWTDPAGDS